MIFKNLITEILGVSNFVQETSRKIRNLINLKTFERIKIELIQPIGELKTIFITFHKDMGNANGRALLNNKEFAVIKMNILNIKKIIDDITEDYGDTDTEEEIYDLVLDEVEDTINHELTHIFEIYSAKSNQRKVSISSYYNYLEKAQSQVPFENSNNVKILNNLLYQLENVEINAEINKYYNKLKNQLFTTQSEFEKVIMFNILKEKFRYYYMFKDKMKNLNTKDDYFLEAYLDYYKMTIYKGKDYQQVYNILWKKVENGIEKFKKKIARLYSLMQQ